MVPFSHLITQQFSPQPSHVPTVFGSHFLKGPTPASLERLPVLGTRVTSLLPYPLEDVVMKLSGLKWGWTQWYHDVQAIHSGCTVASKGRHPLPPVVPQAIGNRFDTCGLIRTTGLLSCCTCSDKVQGCLAGTFEQPQWHRLDILLSYFPSLDTFFHHPCPSLSSPQSSSR